MSRPVAVQRLDDGGGTVERYELPPEKRIEGNPTQTVWTQYADAAGRFFVGRWHSERGKWHVRYTEEEWCEVLEGTSVITAADGVAVTVGAGDRFVVPAGFVGTWEVVEPTTKRFVIGEPGAPD